VEADKASGKARRTPAPDPRHEIRSARQRIEPFYVMEVGQGGLAWRARWRTPTAHDLPEHRRARLHRAAAGAGGRRARHPRWRHPVHPGHRPAALRERISDWYQPLRRAGAGPRIVVTAGASAALQLACLALIEAGDEILMPDPSYPCNRQFVSAADGLAVLIPHHRAERFQLSAAKVEAAWGPRRAACCWPRPPTPPAPRSTRRVARIHEVVQQRGGITLLDEIYLGLSHDDAFGQTALALDDQVISINSFSKYFNMTGWRLGWLVVPEALVPVVERLAQNLFICPSTIAQHAALACFEADSMPNTNAAAPSSRPGATGSSPPSTPWA
jgi:aspartate/methionine/tyrosine aminotransferase